MKRHVVMLLAAVIWSGGCSSGGGYVLRGKAIEGFISDMMVVAPDDATLAEEAGVPGVRVEVWRDPDSLGREMVASGRTKPDGTLELPIKAFGVGWMKEDWLVTAVRQGFETAQTQMSLPPSGDRLLIMLRPGPSIIPKDARTRDLDDFEKFR